MSDIENYHKEKDEFVGRIEEREEQTGRELYVRPTRNSSAKLPLPVLFDNKNAKLNYRNSAVWVLTALGTLTPTEYNEFITKNKDKLTVNELIACRMLEETQQNDPKATERFWGIQRDLLKFQSRNSIVSQSDSLSTSDNTMIANVMDRVKSNFIQNYAKSAKTVEIDEKTDEKEDH